MSSTGKSKIGKRTGIVGILLLSDALDRAVVCREQTTPNTKVTAENRCSCLDGSDGTYPSLSVGAVSESLDTVPDGTTDRLYSDIMSILFRQRRIHNLNGWKTYTHAESTAEIAQGDPGAGISRMIHGECMTRMCKK